MAKMSSDGRTRDRVFGLVMLIAVGVLGICGGPAGRAHAAASAVVPAAAGDAQQTGKADKATAQPKFDLERAAGEPRNGNSAIVLQFNRPLAPVQKFQELISLRRGKNYAYGYWVLSEDGKTLFYPNVTPKGSYQVTINASLKAADGTELGEEVVSEVAAGEQPASLSFASSGSVLPARGSRGLPVVSTNVQRVNIEYYRIREDALSTLFCLYPNNSQRSRYDLGGRSYRTCEGRPVQGGLDDLGTPVYANYYTLKSETDVRNLTYIPIQNVPQLAEPGVYMAVLRNAEMGSYNLGSSVFYVSDQGLHVRLYEDNAFLHVASLQNGKPLAGVQVSLNDAHGATLFSGRTDKSGNLQITHKVEHDHVLIARQGKDISVLPFNRPALDISNFDVSGRPQAPVEIFTWSGRDLYRPGETPRVSALLRDFDGKALPAQPLFARLVQPDGRKLADVRLEAGALNQFEWSQAIANDAPTGSWQLEWRLDPASAKAVGVFNFQVEEFLPERLKLELANGQSYLKPDEAFELKVKSSYLYGSPADGNRFTARLAAKAEVHPLPNLTDTYFGNPFAKVVSSDKFAIDTELAADGTLEQQLPLPAEVKPDRPYSLVLTGSVYETGGRAVTRSLSRTYWPANALVGVRPLFDTKQGANSLSEAPFEILRANIAGELVAGSKLKVRLLEEDRYSYWYRDRGDDWQAQQDVDLELVEERVLDVPAGQSLKVNFPVRWGSYRLEVTDPQTNLTSVFPFHAGYSWEDANSGKEALPDKVKVALDKTAYRAGDTLKVTVTPPQEGPGLLLVESDHLLYSRTIQAKAGATFDIPVTADWERQDVHVVALVFRGGMAKDLTTPARAIGIEHVTMQRNDRRIGLKLTAPGQVRPQEPLEVTVQADGLAGQKAFVRLTAVDQGVLNITNYPEPDAWSWLYSKRALGTEAYDLYGRLIEAMKGDTARQSFGGDLVGRPLPKAARLNPRVQIADLLAEPVQFDEQGKALVKLDVPDFNGSLRVSALAYGEQSYGNASTSVTVRAPLLVEPSMPRVMAGGDQAQISLDVKNFSGKSGVARISVRGSGPIEVQEGEQNVALEDGAGATLRLQVKAQPGVDVAKLDIQAGINDYKVQRHFEFAVRSAWPQTVRSVPMALSAQQETILDASSAQGLVASTLNGQLTLSTLPPLPYRQALEGLRYYPYGCIEQTTSGGYAALVMDKKTVSSLNIDGYSESVRRSTVNRALARIASFQTSSGHFTFWGGSSSIVPYITPYVVDFMLDARDAGFAVPEAALQKALETLSEDLISGDISYFDQGQRAHLDFAYRAHAAFVLARVNRASLGAMRTLYDNHRQDVVSPLPLVHLGIALKLMGDNERGLHAIAQGFDWSATRPVFVGDYGSELRDLAVMVALTHGYGVNRPEYDAKLVDWARQANSRVLDAKAGSYYYGWSWYYMSTQERVAIARILQTFNDHPAPLSVSLEVGGKGVEVPVGSVFWTREVSPADLASGVKLKPTTDAPVFASFDVAGISEQPPVDDGYGMQIERQYFLPDGTPWQGSALKEGDSLIVQLKVHSNWNVVDAMVTDLLPGGLEVENLNLSGTQAWANVVVDGIPMERYEREAEIVHQEYRDDRYAAAVKLQAWRDSRLFYLVRAVTPGTYTVPPPQVEDMYRPAIRGIGVAPMKTLTVGSP
ncbi:alpha-2-macroglobulin family protein [Pseudomonas sp. PDM23]|uniref:alpha-2-macroglobulin family protein n=1 Tax=unclassified Pseudomonas TaxID=196821 RepID=UPI0017859834|nr:MULTISPECIES: alpha-2-macroglobulin [unclassified Pseudomonas]MBD9578734.1 alpha-2-macroglobulin family protein [Pseudomonas sp. PDM23]MBD9674058.1 alpha-2-macroglobulin family protein [Pseudomonas sp. PDM21]